MIKLSSPQRFYLLDLLRVVAIFRVILWHWSHFSTIFGDSLSTSQLPLYNVFYIFYKPYQASIPLFFCVSGFTFFWLYSTRVADKKLSFRAFIIQRLSRLYPLHFTTLLLVVAGQIVYAHMTDAYFTYSLFDVRHFLLNVLMISSWGFEKGFSFNGPAWLISVMLLLYILFFVFCRLFHRNPVALVLMTFLGFFLVPNVNRFIGTGIKYFFLGGIIYLIYRRVISQGDPWRASTWLPAITLVFWVITLIWTNPFFDHARESLGPVAKICVSYWAYIVLLPSTILAAALYETRNGPTGAKISFLGERIYGMYLFHFPLQLFFAILAVGWGWESGVLASVRFMVIFFAILFTLATISRRFLELPAQNYLRSRI